MSNFDDVFDAAKEGKSPEEMLDFTPLKFGKYKGKTPEYVAENDPSYLRWMYETVVDHATCSAALYKDTGGTRRKASRVEDYQRQQQERQPKRDKFGFDDMDDDIPF